MSFDATSIADLWRCPKSHSTLVVDGDFAICTNQDCRLKYEIRDSIPVMLIDEAQTLSPEDWSTSIARSSAAK
jgi:uncharacterized protein YbaR (Trm112 family)